MKQKACKNWSLALPIRDRFDQQRISGMRWTQGSTRSMLRCLKQRDYFGAAGRSDVDRRH